MIGHFLIKLFNRATSQEGNWFVRPYRNCLALPDTALNGTAVIILTEIS